MFKAISFPSVAFLMISTGTLKGILSQVQSFFQVSFLSLIFHNIIDNFYALQVYKLATIIEGNPKAPFSIATTPMCRGGRYSFPGLLYFTLDPYLMMLSVKQGGIKYHFLSLWYDSTWDWTQISRAIGEHSNP